MVMFVVGTILMGLALLGLLFAESMKLVLSKNLGMRIAGIYGLLNVIGFIVWLFI